MRDDDGRRAGVRRCEKFQTDPHFRDHVLFYEYFHGDNGRGLGASPSDRLDGAGGQAAHAAARAAREQGVRQMVKSKTNEQLPDVVMPCCEAPRVLEGQRALVTGGNSGIGKAVALALGQAGADVVVNYVSGPERAEEVVQTIRAADTEALAIRADVSREDEVEAMFSEMLERWGTIDILVNNAGLQRDAPFDELTLADWQKVLDVNLTGQFLCARAAVREFKRRGVIPEVSCSAGKIICISSVHEVIPWAGHVNYAASKGGVMLMMKSLAQELAPHRIRVNSIGPGAIRTPINTDAWETPEAYERLMELIPYKRIGEPGDIGRAAAWLASDQADYINGTTMFIDGGMTCYPGFATGG
jgi:glucose 1-dehydrogenase